MTLDTRVYALTPVSAKETFDYCRALLGAGPSIAWSNRESWSDDGSLMYANGVGQGLCALLDVRYRPEEPLRTPEQSAQHDEWCDEGCTSIRHDGPPAFIEVSFDTAYGYRGPNGQGCGYLHAALVSALGEWFDSRGVDWSWQNEFTGDIYHRFDGFDTLGEGGREASSWYVNTVLPAIKAESASRD